MRILGIASFLVLFFSCSQNKSEKHITKVDRKWLDSIKSKSDTSWIKKYRNKEFATAEYYIDKKDSIVTQVMKDTAGIVRQIITAKYDNIRLFFAEYYVNGQLQAKLPLDNNGKYNGKAEFYYENGNLKSSGIFMHGLYSGEWKNYDEEGRQISTDTYNSKGELVKTIKM